MGVKPIVDNGFLLNPFMLSPFSVPGVMGPLKVRVGLGGAETAAS
jgi:hypothetical protein